MADTPARHRFKMHSWAVNLGITVVVIASVFAICQESDGKADTKNSSPLSSTVAQNSASPATGATSNTAAGGNSTSPTNTQPSSGATQTPSTNQTPSTSQTPSSTSPSRLSPAQPEDDLIFDEDRTGGGPDSISTDEFQSDPNPQFAPNPQAAPNPQLNQLDPFDEENRQIQLDERQQRDEEILQRQENQRQLGTDPFEQEDQQSQTFQRDENGLLIEDDFQTNDIDNPEQFPQVVYYDNLIPAEVIVYSQFLARVYPDALTDSATSYSYVADGIRHVADALFALSEQTDSVPNQRAQYHDDLNNLADQLLLESTDFDASQITSNAFVEITNWMQQISDSSFPFSKATTEVNDAESVARKIEANRSLQDQQYEIRRFFYLTERAIHTLAQ